MSVAVQRLAVLPADGECLLRLRTVLALYPVSVSEWKRGLKDGRYPPPVQLTPRVPAWRASDIRALLEQKTNHQQKEGPRWNAAQGA